MAHLNTLVVCEAENIENPSVDHLDHVLSVTFKPYEYFYFQKL